MSNDIALSILTGFPKVTKNLNLLVFHLYLEKAYISTYV